MAALDVSEEELASLAGEVLARLAEDERAAHLWHWSARPGCEDEPAGPARRRHLQALLALLSVGASAPLASACGGRPRCPDVGVCEDAPPPCDDEPPDCADDPCACGDDPCGQPGPPPPRPPPSRPCADDPCACADDPCAM